ncbi:guanylin-like [Saccopteryx leptura]|uniref:guanylin-like n=1 Tax=Saccopteryx leptura TaxID=249018 RepID=UPI00339D27FC
MFSLWHPEPATPVTGTAAMNTFLLTALCLLGTWADLTQGVTVHDGKFSFPLESVKKLKILREFQELQEPGNWRRMEFDGPVVPTLCKHRNFPKDLKPLCKEPDAQEILQRLEAIAEDPSTCELCAYAACAGC